MPSVRRHAAVAQSAVAWAAVALLAVASLGGCSSPGADSQKQGGKNAEACPEDEPAPAGGAAAITGVRTHHGKENVRVRVDFSEIDPDLEQHVSLHFGSPGGGWILDLDRIRGRDRPTSSSPGSRTCLTAANAAWVGRTTATASLWR